MYIALEQLKRKFTGRYGEPNEYEIKVLDDKYYEISNKIQKEIEERERLGMFGPMQQEFML